MTLLSVDEQISAMRRANVSERAIERWKRDRGLEGQPDPVACVLRWPLHFTIPWSALCSDNYRYQASMVTGSNGQKQPRMVLTARYAAARDAIEHIVRSAVDGAQPAEQPLFLHAQVWTPDRRAHDCANFCKVVHDAMEKIVFTNDRWLHRVLWENVGVDVDRPRAEITVVPLATSP